MNKQTWKRDFYTIWSGQAISLITSSVLQMAIIWYLTDTTGSAMVLSIAAMVGFLPQAILGTIIGALVDRWNRKWVMIGADLIIMAGGVVLAILAISAHVPVWVVMVILFVRSIGTAFHSPALSAVTPLMVPENQLTKCSGYTQSLQSVSLIISPAMAGFLYARWNLNTVIALDVLGTLVACITVLMVVIPKQKTKPDTVHTSIIAESKAGYRIVKENQGLFTLLWIGAMYCFIYMPISALFPLMSMRYFRGTTTHASLVEIFFAVGMLVGGLVLGAWGGFRKRYISIVLSLALMGAALTLVGSLPTTGFVIFVICCIFMGFSAPFYSGVQMALFQEKIPAEYLGRVFGLLGSVLSLSMPFGLIISGIFADRVGINRWFSLSGIFILALAALSILHPSLKKLDK